MRVCWPGPPGIGKSIVHSRAHARPAAHEAARSHASLPFRARQGYGGSANSWDYPYVCWPCPPGLGESPPHSRLHACRAARRMMRGLTHPSRDRPLTHIGCTSTTRRLASPSPSVTASPPSRRMRRPNPKTSFCCTTRTGTSSGRTAPTSRWRTRPPMQRGTPSSRSAC